MRIARHTPKSGRVEIIPMIDRILTLQIIYRSFSTLTAKEKRLEARLTEYPPGLTTEQINIPPPEITIHVRSKDAFIVNGVTYEPGTLRDSLAALRAVAPETKVIIDADPETRYQAVINAADVCAQAKLRHLAFRPGPLLVRNFSATKELRAGAASASLPAGMSKIRRALISVLPTRRGWSSSCANCTGSVEIISTARHGARDQGGGRAGHRNQHVYRFPGNAGRPREDVAPESSTVACCPFAATRARSRRRPHDIQPIDLVVVNLYPFENRRSAERVAA